MDRLAHFHFIIIFSSHRWSSVSFCSAPSAVRPTASLLFPVFLPSFLSFSREINTHNWTGRATGESRRLGDELREREKEKERKVPLDGQKIAERKMLLRRTASSYLSAFYIDNNFDSGSLIQLCVRKYVHAVLIMPCYDAIFKLSVTNSLRIWQSTILFGK